MTIDPTTTDEVRAALVDRRDFEAQVGYLPRPTDDQTAAAFDAWLAARDRAVVVAALMKAAYEQPGPASELLVDLYREFAFAGRPVPDVDTMWDEPVLAHVRDTAHGHLPAAPDA